MHTEILQDGKMRDEKCGQKMSNENLSKMGSNRPWSNAESGMFQNGINKDISPATITFPRVLKQKLVRLTSTSVPPSRSLTSTVSGLIDNGPTSTFYALRLLIKRRHNLNYESPVNQQ